MTPESAHELLLFHSCRHHDTDDPRWKDGFLGMLRPYQGLHEDNFHSVMACLRALVSTLQSDTVDRDIVGSVWAICHLARAWAIWPGGMLPSNNLISTEDVTRLEVWIDQISYTTFCILDGELDEAFHQYDRTDSW